MNESKIGARKKHNKIKLLFGFFTRFPVKMQFMDFSEVAEGMWLLPIVGFAISITVGILGYMLFFIIPPLIVGFLLLSFLILLTGGHHTDGLLDFGDGLMVMGSAERKIEVMHEVSIGAGGFIVGLLIYSITGITLSFIHESIFMSLFVSVIGAKFSMVISCCTGKSAQTKTADKFIMLNGKKELLKSFFLSVLLLFIGNLMVNLIDIALNGGLSLEKVLNLQNYGIYSLIFIIGSFVSSFWMNYISKKHFNGLNGDTLGALNEISRIFLLIICISMRNLIIL